MNNYPMANETLADLLKLLAALLEENQQYDDDAKKLRTELAAATAQLAERLAVGNDDIKRWRDAALSWQEKCYSARKERDALRTELNNGEESHKLRDAIRQRDNLRNERDALKRQDRDMCERLEAMTKERDRLRDELAAHRLRRLNITVPAPWNK